MTGRKRNQTGRGTRIARRLGHELGATAPTCKALAMMYTSLFQSTTIPVLEQLADFAQTRHTVLAGNIANLDTPGYLVRDLPVEDFQARLKKAIESRRQPQPARSPGELAYLLGDQDRQEPELAKVARDSKTILRHDKDNVGMEHQVSEMVKNQLQHNLAIALLTKQFRLLEVAISGRL
jgi:flagellar basal-body rod protein FlgB